MINSDYGESMGKYICFADDYMDEGSLHKIKKGDIVEIFIEKDAKLDGYSHIADLYSIYKDGIWIISTIQLDKINKHFKSFKEIREDKIDSLL